MKITEMTLAELATAYVEALMAKKYDKACQILDLVTIDVRAEFQWLVLNKN